MKPGNYSQQSEAKAKQTKIATQDLTRLRERMASGELKSFEDIRAWIERECGVNYTARGVAKLVERELQAERVWSFNVANQPSQPRPTAEPTTKALIHFLNHIKITGKPSEDTLTFKEGLLPLLDNVDRVSIYTSVTDCGPDGWYQTTIIDRGISVHQEAPLKPAEIGQPKSFGKAILQHLRSQAAPLHLYHDPVILEYYTDDRFYLGSIFLWQNSSKPARPLDATLVFLESIAQFIRHVLYLIRSQYDRSNFANQIFHESLNSTDWRAGLSHRELKVLTFRLYGFSYEEIAEELSISRSTVHKHIIAIHRKTKTSSIIELFGKYFTPRFNMDGERSS